MDTIFKKNLPLFIFDCELENTVKTTALEFTKLLYEAPKALEIRANTLMLQWKTIVRARALDSSAHNCSLALRLVLLLFLTELALS